MIAAVKAWWISLTERDQYVLSIGGVILAIYLFYQLIISPLNTATVIKSRLYIDKKETLFWMEQQRIPSSQKMKLEGNLLSIFSTQLKKSSFAQFPFQLQQAGESRVQLTFNEVPYSDFLIWLKLLNEEYPMAITEFNVEKTKTPGVVKLKLIAESKGGKS